MVSSLSLMLGIAAFNLNVDIYLIYIYLTFIAVAPVLSAVFSLSDSACKKVCAIAYPFEILRLLGDSSKITRCTLYMLE